MIAASCATTQNPNCVLRVRAATGTELLRGFPAFRATETAVYTIEVFGSVGPWTLTTGLMTDDHGNDRATSTPLTLGVRMSGTNEYFSDQDYFSFTVNAGTQIHVEPQPDCTLVLRAPNNSGVIAFGDSIESALLMTAGQYTLSVRGCGAGYSFLVSL